MSPATSEPVSILLVDDDEIDRQYIQRAFAKQKIANPIVCATDGMEALDRIRGTNGHKKLAAPYLILLDLNMPRMNGHEFLRELRADAEIAASIVFVLTTSERNEDIAKSYEQHVAGYITKSAASEDLGRLTSLLDSYWRLNEFPH